MKHRPIAALFLSAVCILTGTAAALDTGPPGAPAKLVFVHHSCGENWLADGDGGLGTALRDNNYFVSDTNYGWGPDGIGDRTDIGNWYDWFLGPNSATYTAALYAESGRNSEYSRLAADPGGENRVVLFKSCFPNSDLYGDPNSPPTTGANPLYGQDSGSAHMTVANAKGIYRDLLVYFSTRPDKLFVAVTAPPLYSVNTDPAQAANARAFNHWLVHDWLDGYGRTNVAVLDFYNVLTSNAGDRNTPDSGAEAGNHHRIWNGQAQHLQTIASNTAAYPTFYEPDEWDNHPNAAGNRKATAELVPLLNAYYHCWQGSGACPVLADVRVNGSGGAATVSAGDPVQVAVSLDAGGGTSPADWWLGIYSPGNVAQPWTHFHLASFDWQPARVPTYQGPLRDLPLYTVSPPVLPAGSHYLFCGVDGIMDGEVNWESLVLDWLPLQVR